MLHFPLFMNSSHRSTPLNPSAPDCKYLETREKKIFHFVTVAHAFSSTAKGNDVNLGGKGMLQKLMRLHEGCFRLDPFVKPKISLMQMRKE